MNNAMKAYLKLVIIILILSHSQCLAVKNQSANRARHQIELKRRSRTSQNENSLPHPRGALKFRILEKMLNSKGLINSPHQIEIKKSVKTGSKDRERDARKRVHLKKPGIWTNKVQRGRHFRLEGKLRRPPFLRAGI